MFNLYQLLFKMVVTRASAKLKWEKAKNCYSASLYSVFMKVFSNGQSKCLLDTQSPASSTHSSTDRLPHTGSPEPGLLPLTQLLLLAFP